MRSLQRDSSEVYKDLSTIGAGRYEVQLLLSELDKLQNQEEISPQLAETIRIAMHQVASENSIGFIEKAVRAFPGRIKYFTENMDDSAFHLIKAAQRLEEETGGAYKHIQIVQEFTAWQQKVDE